MPQFVCGSCGTSDGNESHGNADSCYPVGQFKSVIGNALGTPTQNSGLLSDRQTVDAIIKKQIARLHHP